MNILKKKEEITVPYNTEWHDYLTRRKVQVMGVVGIEDNTVICKNGSRYKVIELSFIYPNGMNKEREIHNKRMLHFANNEIANNKKLILLRKQLNKLDENIAYYKYLLNNAPNAYYKEALSDRIKEMECYNKIKTHSMMLMIEDKDFNNVLDKYRVVFNCRVLEGNELLEYLRLLNNEMEI